jgi:hypothetical protein
MKYPHKYRVGRRFAMKKQILGAGFIALLLIMSGVFSYGQENPGWEHKPGDRMPGGRMMEGGEMPFRPGMPMEEKHGMLGMFIPGMETIVENYRIKVQKVFLDAKQARIDLDIKRKEDINKIRLLAGKYKTDKSVGKDILDVTKELNSIHDQIMIINQEAMKKIDQLNQDREKEIKTARDVWIKKIETDTQELEKYIDVINKRAEKGPNR